MFKLALALGRTVSELERGLSYDELIEWQAYDRIDPFGGFRQDLQTAYLLYAKAGGTNCTVADFLPVDPNPMIDEMREEYEQFKKEQELQRQSEALMRMFDRLEKA
ncbi:MULTISPECIES: phage tail assembly protein T [unclassified Moraxella]|uniref:phage tail assembly protein T n=1 Tax=unclassified Moraxella TaxID=2685852 RepID=UPI002B40B047|nr:MULTISPECIES: phage tail protein [unclassified Moraxella]